MSRSRSVVAFESLLRRQAPVFASLGDQTRLTLLARLCERPSSSISQLAEASPITRQAITKHLEVLERVGLVRSELAGRERRFEFDARPIVEARDYLDLVWKHWGAALDRLKAHVERCP